MPLVPTYDATAYRLLLAYAECSEAWHQWEHGDGIPGEIRTLGGDEALKPLPKPTPIRQLVLWGVLVLAVGALVAMALSLLRRVGDKKEGDGG